MRGESQDGEMVKYASVGYGRIRAMQARSFPVSFPSSQMPEAKSASPEPGEALKSLLAINLVG